VSSSQVLGENWGLVSQRTKKTVFCLAGSKIFEDAY
jgi:hypothetical protein